MAQKVLFALLSDLALAEDPDSTVQAARTVRLSLDGEHFEIDLSLEEIDELEAKLAPYKAAGRRKGRAARPGSPRGPRSGARTLADSLAIRAWARANGHDVKDRGKIPGPLVAQYEAAQGA